MWPIVRAGCGDLRTGESLGFNFAFLSALGFFGVTPGFNLFIYFW